MIQMQRQKPVAEMRQMLQCNAALNHVLQKKYIRNINHVIKSVKELTGYIFWLKQGFYKH